LVLPKAFQVTVPSTTEEYSHSIFEISIVIKGGISYFIGRQKISLSPGGAVIIPARKKHFWELGQENTVVFLLSQSNVQHHGTNIFIWVKDKTNPRSEDTLDGRKIDVLELKIILRSLLDCGFLDKKMWKSAIRNDSISK
jgi:gentisate 1,2-dioxygenase